MRILSIAVTALLLAETAEAARQPFSAHDLVTLERVSAPRVSPDGRHVAYQLRQTDLAANKGVNGLWLVDLAQSDAPPRRLTATGVESNTGRWGADGQLYFLSPRSGSQQLWRLSLEGGEAQRVTDLPLDVRAFALAPDARRVVLAVEVFRDCANLACTRARLDARASRNATGDVFERLFVRHWDTWKDGRRSQLFLFDLVDDRPNREPRRLIDLDADVPTQPFGDDAELAFTPDGRALLFTARVAGASEAWSTNTDIYRVALDGKGRVENLTPGGAGYDTGPAVSADGRWLAYRSMARAGFEADRQRVMLRDLRSGQTREVAPDWDRSSTSLQWSADQRTLYALADDLGQHRLFALDVASGEARALTGDGFVASFDVGADAIVYAHDTLGAPAQLFRIAIEGGTPRALTRHNEAHMAQRALGAYEPFKFAGWNGETVHGYVVKPAGFAKRRKYPVVFIIHGGPQGSMGNHWHYRWNPQTYAGAGYAVVFVDFHGSTGYGQAFTDSISGDWGGKPLVDLQKGWAAALAQFDFLDSRRACALGASYGGYMINWIAGNWPDAFDCFVNHDGVFDMRAMAYATEELWFTEWENGGTPYQRPELVERFNPVNHVSRWKTPMLVIHGGLDFRIPETQGIAAFTALQRRGIPSQFLRFPNENHWVLKPHNSLQWHETVEAWLARWLR